MPVPRLSALVGGLMLWPAGRRFVGRHAGKVALATLALQLWEARQGRRTADAPPGAAPGRPRRWSGRNPSRGG